MTVTTPPGDLWFNESEEESTDDTYANLASNPEPIGADPADPGVQPEVIDFAPLDAFDDGALMIVLSDPFAM